MTDVIHIGAPVSVKGGRVGLEQCVDNACCGFPPTAV